MDVRAELAKLRTAAEQNIEPVIRALDRESAWKMRDEVLGFRRRFRIFATTPGEPYITHMRASAKSMPEYVAFMEAHPEKFEPAETARAKRLQQALEQMIKLVDDHVFPFTAAG